MGIEMVDTVLTTEIALGARGSLPAGHEEGHLLAAALAAALVEYRRYVGQRHGHASRASSGSNWQMVARLEQLRSQV
jgi:hypothetical protein